MSASRFINASTSGLRLSPDRSLESVAEVPGPHIPTVLKAGVRTHPAGAKVKFLFQNWVKRHIWDTKISTGLFVGLTHFT